MGPGTKLPSLGHIAFADLAAAYEPLAEGLLAGGCDLLLIETCQDLLQLRAALAGVRRVFARFGRRVPVGLQITVETSGAMLLGTEPSAAVAALLPLRPDFIGLNCATGPDMMREHLRTLCRLSPVPVSVMPNAGLPRNEDGRMVYDLTPDDFAAAVVGFVESPGVNLVGGCCGTEPRHLRALAERLGERPAPARAVEPVDALSSLYQAVTLDQQPRPLIVGERTNANGSKRFRELQAAGDLDGLVGLALEQQREGAHALDVCVAYVGRDEAADMAALVARLNTEVQLPLMIDSTEPAAIATALECLAGRAIVNSVNLEDGPDKARRILALCRDHGAAVVALCIDERGMAQRPERKLEVARRLADLAAEFGLSPSDMLFDPLTFTLASGDPAYVDSARATLEGLRLIKAEIPGARTLLGVSNVSFGLKSRVRRVLNSVFLQRALDAGLDAAIMHAGRILGTRDVPAELHEACSRLIDGDASALPVLLESEGVALQAAFAADLPLEARLEQRIVAGDASGLEADLDAALADRDPLSIINDVLLAGMRTVGELFGAGRLQLPFVLKSAETMKAAVRHLEPHMARSDAAARGRFVIATVRGDVHDIGKNLVDIILTNNGFSVHNLGIKVPVEQLIEVIRRDAPDVVGLSGLLVKSTLVMRDNLEAFNAAGIDVPVVLGGAALTRKYVESDLRRIYKGPVYYARDAFDGLALAEAASRGQLPPAEVREEGDAGEKSEIVNMLTIDVLNNSNIRPADVPTPPFWGTRVSDDFDLHEVWRLLNRAALVKGRWGYTRAGLPRADFERLTREEIEPALAKLKEEALADGWLRPAAVHGWFPAAADGDTLLVWDDPDATDPRWRLDFPRQAQTPGRCLADYFRSAAAGRDVLGVMAVTMGPEATVRCRALFEGDDYRAYLLAHGFAVESAEALAELVHARLRAELGLAGDDDPDPAQLIKGRYRGCRYSFGYPACPELDDQRLLAEMLDWGRIGIALTEECQLDPEQSVSALVVHHPEAGYFAV
jgi:5-methyltetrahydrofolate--homocysteine methyltransferase